MFSIIAAAAWAGKLLMDKGIISFEELKQMYATYLANLFRYIRYGGASPHGVGAAAEFSYLMSLLHKPPCLALTLGGAF